MRHIVTINPSYAEPKEQEFWDRLAGGLHASRIRVLEIAARKIPGGFNRDTVIFPARLAEMSAKLAKADREGAVHSIEWLSEADISLLIDWETLRWPEQFSSDDIRDGLLRLAHVIDFAIGEHRPDVVLSTNKIDHPCYLSKLAAEFHGVPWRLVERSPFESYWLERRGMFAESEIWQAAATADFACNPRFDGTGELMLSRMLANPAGFRSSEASSAALPPEFTGLKGPVVFLPMDNVLWTGWAQAAHPQNPIDNPFDRDPASALKRIADAVRALGGTLLVKPHPSCRQITRETIPADTHWTEGNIGPLIALSDIVVGFNTKLLFVALAHGKPVLCLSPNPVAACGIAAVHSNATSLDQQIAAALERGAPADARVTFRRFCGWLEQDFFALSSADRELRRDSMQILARELDHLGFGREVTATDDRTDPYVDKLANLRALGSGARGRYLSTREDRFARRGRAFKLVPGRRMRILYDVWRLAQTVNSPARLGGVNRYITETLASLRAHDDLDVHFAIFPEAGIAQTASEIRFNAAKRDVEAWLGTRAEILFPVSARTVDPSKFDLWVSPINSLPPTSFTRGIPRVIVVYDLIHLKGSAYWEHKSRPPLASSIESIDVDSDFVICISEATKADLVRLLPIPQERVFVTHLAASNLFSEPLDMRAVDTSALPLTETYCLCLGQLELRKNIVRTIGAFAQLVQKHAFGDVKLVLVLPNPSYRDRMVDILQKNGIGIRNVIMLFDVSNEQLKVLYHHAQFFVYASLDEGFGIPVLEAMASGCPVLTSGRSSMREIGDGASLLCDPLDGDSIRTGMERLFSDAALRDRLKEEGLARASRFSWKRTTEETFSAFEAILEMAMRDPIISARRDFWQRIEKAAQLLPV